MPKEIPTFWRPYPRLSGKAKEGRTALIKQRKLNRYWRLNSLPDLRVEARPAALTTATPVETNAPLLSCLHTYYITKK